MLVNSNCNNEEGPAPATQRGIYGDPYRFLPGDPMVMGDAHFLLFTPQSETTGVRDLTKVPLNLELNNGNTGTLWFVIQKTTGTASSVYYEQQSFPAVTGGYSLSKIVINVNGASFSYEADSSLFKFFKNGIDWNGIDETFVFEDMLKITVRGRKFAAGSACVGGGTNPQHALLEFSCAPIKSWKQPITKIGGAFYYILKAAASIGSGPINNSTGAGIDGLTNFLSVVGKRSTDFQSSTPIESAWEDYTEQAVEDIANKYNELMNLTGACNLSYDPTASSSCFTVTEVPLDDDNILVW